jgi:hypothetical protein
VALPVASPTIEDLSKTVGEEVVKRYPVSIGENHTADLVVLRDRINVYLESSEKPVAVLRFGSRHSGALWQDGNLIGEFRRESPGSFVVVEIEDGFKRPTPIEDTDPLEYLLHRLRASPLKGPVTTT